MTLETGVKELAEAVGADVKALDAGKVDSNDPRLTDSREWSEDTVPQAEAEEGAASARRAWTAQRVRQAINAWWQLVTSGFGRNFIAATNEQAARNVLQLGTAATRDVGESSGNVLEVGAGGWLGRPNVISNLVTEGLISRAEVITTTNPTGFLTYGCGLNIPSYDSLFSLQIGSEIIFSNAPKIVARHITNGVENDPVTLCHTGNILTATGQSAEYPMTQKAVTDALANTGALASPSATYEYDALGRVDKIVTPQGNTVIGYNPDGTVETITYPTGRVETFTYDMSGNVVSMTATGG